MDAHDTQRAVVLVSMEIQQLELHVFQIGGRFSRLETLYGSIERRVERAQVIAMPIFGRIPDE